MNAVTPARFVVPTGEPPELNPDLLQFERDELFGQLPVRSGRPLLYDLFCSAGGASMGYHLAGFDVVGVDIAPQPNYPFKFIQDDAFEFFERHVDEPDAWAASPECRDHTPLTSVAGYKGTAWQLARIQEMFATLDKPWVIENVAASPLKADIALCGGMFGLRTYRHRKFKSNVPLVAPKHPKHVIKTATKQRRQRWNEGWHVSITGDVGVYVGPEAMGIDWMSGNELSQAIPPAYTEHIGRQLIAHLATS